MKIYNQKKKSIQQRLLKWYGENARDLPWRRTKDPYAVWISEIMLQQTQVKTVIPYYKKFLQRLSNVKTLSRAHRSTVLKLWEGLGYYKRAVNLHKASRIIVSDYDGKFPKTSKQLQRLPGVGRYTSCAIASIAFDENVPVVDGNVTRVLSRLFRIKDNTSSLSVHKKLWNLASALIPAKNAGTFNQALMELGSRACIPKNPHCMECPLKHQCMAKKFSEQEIIPFHKSSKKMPFKKYAVAIICKDNKVLINKRSSKGLLAGLWEFPTFTKNGRSISKPKLQKIIHQFLGLKTQVQHKCTAVEHKYSHFTAIMTPYICDYVSGSTQVFKRTKWIVPIELNKFAFSKGYRKVIEAANKQLSELKRHRLRA